MEYTSNAIKEEYFIWGLHHIQSIIYCIFINCGAKMLIYIIYM